MPPKPPLNPRLFPRPPLLERTPRLLEIKHKGHILASTSTAYWVLETTHAPTYYLPRSSLRVPLQKSKKTSFCEWKGEATYWDICIPTTTAATAATTTAATTTADGSQGKAEGTVGVDAATATKTETEMVRNRIWSYEAPTAGFEGIRGYLSFYAGPWECFVDGERVQAQPGDFYGGWVTAEIVGETKGGPGSWGW